MILPYSNLTETFDTSCWLMDPLQNAKFADGKTGCIVDGYIHDNESKLKLAQIHSLIFTVILGFYYHAEFISKYLKDNFKVTDDRSTISNIEDISCNDHTIYFNQWIESKSTAIVEWMFRINKVIKAGQMYFGITSKEKAITQDFAADASEWSSADASTMSFGPTIATKDDVSYSVNGLGTTFKGIYISGRKPEFTIEQGNSVTFILDLVSKKFCGRIKGEDNIAFFSDIEVSQDIKYKFVLQMGSCGESVTLQTFDVSQCSD